MRAAAAAGARSAVIFGSAVDPPDPSAPDRDGGDGWPRSAPFPGSFAATGPRPGRGCASGSRRSRGTRGWPCAGPGAWGS